MLGAYLHARRTLAGDDGSQTSLPHLISLGNGNGWPQSTFTLQTDGTGDQTGSSPQRPLG